MYFSVEDFSILSPEFQTKVNDWIQENSAEDLGITIVQKVGEDLVLCGPELDENGFVVGDGELKIKKTVPDTFPWDEVLTELAREEAVVFAKRKRDWELSQEK